MLPTTSYYQAFARSLKGNKFWFPAGSPAGGGPATIQEVRGAKTGGRKLPIIPKHSFYMLQDYSHFEPV